MSNEKYIADLEEGICIYGDTRAAAISALRFQDKCQPKDAAAERQHCEDVAITLVNVRSPKTGAGSANHFQTYAADLLMRERAAVRAECADKIKHLEESLMHEYKCANEYHTKLTAVRAECAVAERVAREDGYAFGRREQTKIDACEIERLRAEHTLLLDRGPTAALAATQAEIERWSKRFSAECAHSAELGTKLTAAQTEIERLIRDNTTAIEMHNKLASENLSLRIAAAHRDTLHTKLTNLRTAAERYSDPDSLCTRAEFVTAINASK